MADGMSIQQSAKRAASMLSGSTAPSTDAASLPAAPATTPSPDVASRTVQRLLTQQAVPYAANLARIPLPARADGMPRTEPRKPAGPMVAPRQLDGGRSPLAPLPLADARASSDLIGTTPDDQGIDGKLAQAQDGAGRMPSRHGLVAYTTNRRGDRVYLTQERWLHIRQNHMDSAPQPRGKRTTTWWPTSHAVGEPSMTDQQVLGVIIDTARRGTLRTEVRDTRMAEYDLPMRERAAYGVSEAKVSMAPDGLVLSAYPGAGSNVLAVYELDAAEHAELTRATGPQTAVAPSEDGRMFQTNVASTTFG